MTTIQELEKKLLQLEVRVKTLEGIPEKDPVFDDVVNLVQEYERVSTALLQRRLKIGYARAARIMDELEENGIVGALEGTTRKVLISDTHKYEKIKKAFKIMSDQQLIGLLNIEIDNPGWKAEKLYYIRALQEEIDARDFDYSEIGGKSSMPLRNKIKLKGKKVQKANS